ncbi:MAG TPA: aminopeptidase P family N-terminal domain-containing protein, partial [Egibacteraceae bacterium]|nr:aminopeptidase P family N-terminal domain-containing protein [Egibacteraceae bacterium]
MAAQPSTPSREALARAQQALGEKGIDALLVGPGADLRYLTGYHALPLERITLLVARADGRHTLLVPKLERPRAEAAGVPESVEIIDYSETDDQVSLAVAQLADLGSAPRLVVGDQLWAMFLLPLRER